MPQTNDNAPKKKSKKKTVLGIAAGLIVLGAIGSTGNANDSASALPTPSPAITAPEVVGRSMPTAAPLPTKEPEASIIPSPASTPTTPFSPTPELTSTPAPEPVNTLVPEPDNTSAPEATIAVEVTPEPTPAKKATTTYILNASTKKFHRPGCSSIKQMKASNKKTVESTYDEMVKKGYSPCKKCFK